MRCPPPPRWFCPLSARRGSKRTHPHVALLHQIAQPPTVCPHSLVVAEAGAPTRQSRHPAPPVTTSTSTTFLDRPSSSLTHPALQSASSPSAATPMKKMTINRRTGGVFLGNDCGNILIKLSLWFSEFIYKYTMLHKGNM